MLLRRGFLVFIVLLVALQLCAGEEERRNDDCNNRDRGRRRRGEERRGQRGQQRRVHGERRKHGQGARAERRRLIPSSRRHTVENTRPAYIAPAIPPPENIIRNDNGKSHINTHVNGNGYNTYTNGHVNGNNGHSNGNNGYNSYSNGHVNGNGNGHHANGHHGNGNGNGYNGNVINGRPSYLCPSGFVRLGNACYLLSQHIATWQEAHFACRDLGSQLASLETAWEDETMRKYLNKNELARLERWIGGIFNWEQRRWIWGSSGKRMSYQGFSRRSPNEDRQWHCVVMDPTRRYRWTHKSCIEQRHYICEAPLQRQLPPKDGNEI